MDSPTWNTIGQTSNKVGHHMSKVFPFLLHVCLSLDQVFVTLGIPLVNVRPDGISCYLWNLLTDTEFSSDLLDGFSEPFEYLIDWLWCNNQSIVAVSSANKDFICWKCKIWSDLNVWYRFGPKGWGEVVSESWPSQPSSMKVISTIFIMISILIILIISDQWKMSEKFNFL